MASATLVAALVAVAKQAVIAEGLTTTDWITAGAVFAGGIVVGRVIQTVLVRTLKGCDSEHSAALVVGRVVGMVAVLAGVVAAMSILDARLGPLLGALGIGGIAVALAAQSILENFIASVILQIRRPFRRGDQVSFNDAEGMVEDVNFRTVVLRSYDGQRVVVPCGQVLRSNIVNYTVHGRRRTSLTVGVDYGTELDQVRKVLLEAVGEVEGVLEQPHPEAWVESFGDSGVNLTVRWWHAPDIATLWRVRSHVAVAVKRALDEAGVEIPYPQLDVRLTPAPGRQEADL